MASLREFEPRPDRVPAAAGDAWRGRRPPLGARPTRRCRVVRGQVDNILADDRSQVEQVEIVFEVRFPNYDHDLVHPPRQSRYDQSACPRACFSTRRAATSKGLIVIEKSAIRTDSYLGEFGMNLSKTAQAVASSARDRSAGLPTRRAYPAPSGRSTDAAVLPRKPGDARRSELANSSSSASSSRSSPVPLDEPRERLREALEAKWAAGFGTGQPRRRERNRRVDLLGVEELPEGGSATGLGGRHGCRPDHPLERRVPRAPEHLQPRVFRARQAS